MLFSATNYTNSRKLFRVNSCNSWLRLKVYNLDVLKFKITHYFRTTLYLKTEFPKPQSAIRLLTLTSTCS